MREVRPGVWRVIVQAGENPITRKRVQLSRTVHGNKRAAQAALDDLRATVPAASPSSRTMQIVIGEWWRGQTRATKTAETWRPLIDKRILPMIGHIPVTAMTAPVVVDMRRRLADDGLPPWQVKHCHAILSSALSYAAENGWCTTNAAKLARAPKVPTKRRKPPGVDVGRRLLDAAAAMDDPTIAVWLRVVLVTGARRAEVLALRWTDLELVDVDGVVWGTLTVARSLTAVSSGQRPGRRPRGRNGERRTGLVVEVPTKTGSEEEIALDPLTVGELVAHRGRVEVLARAADVRFNAGGYIFAASLDGRVPHRPEWATRMSRRVCAAAGVEGVRLHDLRHRAAAVAMASGLSAQATAGHLRHASPKMTLDVYGGAIDDEERQVALVLARSLDGPGPS